ncbi:hypothetical protein G4G27_07010 [Sphingomonas sp. So64.6b]|uniref:hypothetical protein n=1 Tax=Sphingomonas sp. So64.6b TaxID=2997354 RepID=UPI001602F05E|nr:hypothetical protein [Sphingomonas sp. So64.6b]QNA83765.1 hypothetical protein G4G27_07010 [Sphingomonas sp. So64.6b]
MIENVRDIALLGLGFGGFGAGIAAIITAWFNGRSKLIRAQRGDPETVPRRPAVPMLVRGDR